MSLRGGTTKQSVILLAIPFVKLIEIVHEISNVESLAKEILLKLTDCFVVPPRNDTFSWRWGSEVAWQIASSYLLAKTHFLGGDLWVIDRVCNLFQTNAQNPFVKRPEMLHQRRETYPFVFLKKKLSNMEKI